MTSAQWMFNQREAEIDRLEAEAEKLREALKEIANLFDDDDAGFRAKEIARAALAVSLPKEPKGLADPDDVADALNDARFADSWSQPWAVPLPEETQAMSRIALKLAYPALWALGWIGITWYVAEEEWRLRKR